MEIDHWIEFSFLIDPPMKIVIYFSFYFSLIEANIFVQRDHFVLSSPFLISLQKKKKEYLESYDLQ